MKYRKKPVVVEAFATEEPMDIETLEGVMHASAGDYIITGVEGERYPCKPDIFKKTYEPAGAEPLSVDRDALLALADEMDGEKRDISCSTCRYYFGLACYDYKPNATCMEACLRYYARRIREALGVQDA